MSATTFPDSNVVRPGLLDRDRIVAHAGFHRWLVPPAALAIHLCIGMAYGFSVFWLPLSRAIGVGKPIACPSGTLLFDLQALDWSDELLALFRVPRAVLPTVVEAT